MGAALALVMLITLHRADGHAVSVSLSHVTAVTPAKDHGHFAPGVNCLIHTDDRKTLAVRETCAEVHHMFKKGA